MAVRSTRSPGAKWEAEIRANLFPRLSSKQVERHAQASHPSSIRLLSQGRSLFLCAFVKTRITGSIFALEVSTPPESGQRDHSAGPGPSQSVWYAFDLR